MRTLFETVQAAQIRGFSATDPRMARRLRAENIVYLYGTLSHEAVLGESGTVIVREMDESGAGFNSSIALGAERIRALVIASRRWPEIREMLPARTPAALACHGCRGTGEILGALCPDCGGLGWAEPALDKRARRQTV